MGDNYSGGPNMGNGSGSSRKGKKSNGDKPKQPQRGLGVAQLEKIRMHNQMGCYFVPSPHTPFHANLSQDGVPRELDFSSSSSSSLYGLNPNIMMGYGEIEAVDTRYHDYQSVATSRWNQNTTDFHHQQDAPSLNATRRLMRLTVQDSTTKKRRQDRCDSTGSSSQNSESTEIQELDLDLKLSL